MHAETHRARIFILSVLLSMLALALFARPAHSGWSAESFDRDVLAQLG